MPPLLDRVLPPAAVLGAGLVGVGLVGGAAPASGAEPDAPRVYVVVVDGLRTEEVALMPFLSSLAAGGTSYAEARAVMVAETVPNHVSMVTGAYPDRTGIPANSFPGVPGAGLPEGSASGEPVEAGDPRLLQADSLFTLVADQCPQLETAAVTSKDYLYSIMDHDRNGDGEVDADYNFANVDDPTFIPGAGLTPDERTIAEALRVSRERDPELLFLNLGSVDRVGHGDEVGGVTSPLPTGSRPAVRDVQRTLTDTYLRTFVEQLRADGRWEHTTLIVTADHGMDWSQPTSTVSLSPAIEADPLLAGEVVAAQNGGAGLYSLVDRTDAQASERLARLREIAVGTEGVEEALYRQPNLLDGGEEHWVGQVHPDWHQTGPRSGDLLVTVEDGLRVTEPEPFSNPVPGNHGMPSTLRIPTIVAGGSGVVAQEVTGTSSDPDVRAPGQAENVDVAPTAAWLLGVSPPDGGFDGRALTEAFEAEPAPVCTEPGAGPSSPATPAPSSTGGAASPTPAATSSPQAVAAGRGTPADSGGRLLAATGAASAVGLLGVAAVALSGAAARRRARRG